MFRFPLLWRILLNNKLSILDKWKLSLSLFSPREKVFNICGINVHFILSKEKPNKLGQLESIILDEAAAAEGFIWINNNIGKNVPCVMYRASKMNKGHKGVIENDFCYIVNEAIIDAKYADSNSVVVVESLYSPGLFGWFINSVSPIDVLSEDEPFQIFYHNFISKNH